MPSDERFLWVEAEVVLAIHDALLAEHGGSSGIRDVGLLDSALARPRNAAVYGEPDLGELATLYAAGIIKNHPFVDGNKRLGLVLLELFLELNGSSLSARDDECYTAIFSFAAGTSTESNLRDWVRTNCRPPTTD